MEKFKRTWEITKNWQLLYPILGIIGLIYSAYKISVALFNENTILIVFGVVVLFYILLKICVFTLKKLEKRWIVNERWQIIRIFIIFAITGTSSLYVTNPILNLIGLTKETFSDNGFQLTIYYILKFIAILPFYQILLLIFGWIFGEYKFFSSFVKKMFSRFKSKKSVKE